MTGPEHYRKAEKLVRDFKGDTNDLRAAQVHATLALAAATAMSGRPADGGSGMDVADFDAWDKVSGVQP